MLKAYCVWFVLSEQLSNDRDILHCKIAQKQKKTAHYTRQSLKKKLCKQSLCKDGHTFMCERMSQIHYLHIH